MNNQIGYSNVIQFMKYNVISYTKPWGYISISHKYNKKETAKPFLEGNAVLCVHTPLHLSNLFLQDLDRLREFTETYKKNKLLSLS